MNRTTRLSSVCTAIVLLLVPLSLVAAGEDEFVSLFDGKTLDGWSGSSKYWSVSDGAIKGKIPGGFKGSTFLIWQGEDVTDFELHLKFRINTGNSGIQFRSADLGNGVVAGYQADIASVHNITGLLFDEKIRKHQFLNDEQGQEIEMDKSGNVQVVGVTATKEKLANLERIQDPEDRSWHDYVVTARGNQVELRVDGVVTIKLTDNDPRAPKSGIIALQLWCGPPVDVEFKDIRLKRF